MNQDKEHIHSLRENYNKFILSREFLEENPIEQFNKWFSEAMDGGVKEPNAMTLSTVDSYGQPSSRIVLLKDTDEMGFTFYTNQESSKGKDIAGNENVSLLFFWIEMQRQVRIQGRATKVDNDVATEYFQSRPKGSQIGAWASHQSEAINNRNILVEKVAELEEKYQNIENLPKPPYWGGYFVKPLFFEFWQGRESRLHDRFQYSLLNNKSWNIVRLSP